MDIVYFKVTADTSEKIDEMFEWLVHNFDRGAWSLENFKECDFKWGWELSSKLEYRIFFKQKSDSTLFKLSWFD